MNIKIKTQTWVCDDCGKEQEKHNGKCFNVGYRSTHKQTCKECYAKVVGGQNKMNTTTGNIQRDNFIFMKSQAKELKREDFTTVEEFEDALESQSLQTMGF